MAQMRSPVRQDEEPGAMADAASGGTKVGAECRLTVRARRHEVVRSAAHETRAEAGHDVAAVVFERNRWHGHADISGEQGHQRIDVS
jgi:hypothetical protein